MVELSEEWPTFWIESQYKDSYCIAEEQEQLFAEWTSHY